MWGEIIFMEGRGESETWVLYEERKMTEDEQASFLGKNSWVFSKY